MDLIRPPHLSLSKTMGQYIQMNKSKRSSNARKQNAVDREYPAEYITPVIHPMMKILLPTILLAKIMAEILLQKYLLY